MCKDQFDKQIKKLFSDKKAKEIDCEKKITDVLKLLEQYIGCDKRKLVAVRTEWEASWIEGWSDLPINLLSIVISCVALIIAMLTFLFDGKSFLSEFEIKIRLAIVLVYTGIVIGTVLMCGKYMNMKTGVVAGKLQYTIKMTALQEYEKMYTETIE